jgi:hypothetical protein
VRRRRLQGDHAEEPQLGDDRLRQRGHGRTAARELLPHHDRIGEGDGKVHDRWSILFAPYARKVRVQGGSAGTHRWLALFDGRAERLQRLIGDIRPYPADRLPPTTEDDLPAPRVVEVFSPAGERAAANSGEGFDAWPLAAGAALAIAALACARRALRGRRRRTAGIAA